jgi:DNA-binding NtrC family response regulator
MSQGVEVMVLDDESMVCERLRGPLTEKGYSVETFTDSADALGRLLTKHFDVVVTDLKMKGATGLDLLRHLRENAPQTQVIIITGYPTIENAREAEFGGVFGLVTKPFKIKELVSLVAKAARAAAHARTAERVP